MCDSLYGILVMWHEEIINTLKDKSINDYTRWKFKRYEMLCNFLLDEYSW